MAQENNASAPQNEGGTYRDPQSGAELTVTMPAGADALVRMGWRQVPTNEDSPQAKAASKDVETDSQVAKVDDADAVEDQQDNAEGHKSETVDGPPGVPAGDPKKIAKKIAKKKGN